MMFVFGLLCLMVLLSAGAALLLGALMADDEEKPR